MFKAWFSYVGDDRRVIISDHSVIQGENSQMIFSLVLKDNGRRRCQRHMKTRPKKVLSGA